MDSLVNLRFPKLRFRLLPLSNLCSNLRLLKWVLKKLQNTRRTRARRL
nr:MAG TPA: hypothetical protein [Caudoviricetes sp.]